MVITCTGYIKPNGIRIDTIVRDAYLEIRCSYGLMSSPSPQEYRWYFFKSSKIVNEQK